MGGERRCPAAMAVTRTDRSQPHTPRWMRRRGVLTERCRRMREVRRAPRVFGEDAARPAVRTQFRTPALFDPRRTQGVVQRMADLMCNQGRDPRIAVLLVDG